MLFYFLTWLLRFIYFQNSGKKPGKWEIKTLSLLFFAKYLVRLVSNFLVWDLALSCINNTIKLIFHISFQKLKKYFYAYATGWLKHAFKSNIIYQEVGNCLKLLCYNSGYLILTYVDLRIKTVSEWNLSPLPLAKWDHHLGAFLPTTTAGILLWKTTGSQRGKRGTQDSLCVEAACVWAQLCPSPQISPPLLSLCSHHLLPLCLERKGDNPSHILAPAAPSEFPILPALNWFKRATVMSESLGFQHPLYN